MVILTRLLKESSYKLDLFAIIFLIIIGLLFFNNIIFGTWIIPWDLLGGHYPIFYDGFQSMQNSEFPLWNPYVLGGSPWNSYFENAPFYPPHLMLMFFTSLFNDFPYLLVELMVISHVILAGIFMYFFSSRSGISKLSSLTTSCIFMFGAFFLSNASHLGIIETMTWTPLLLLFIKRALNQKKSWLYVSIPVTFALLAGHPPTFFTIMFFGFFYVVGMSFFREKKLRFNYKPILSFVAISLISLCIAAIFLVPAVEYHGFYSINKGVKSINTGFQPSVLMTILNPSIFGTTTNFGTNDLDYWAPFELTWTYLYLGIFPIILFFIAIRHRLDKETIVLSSIAVFALFESISNLTPLPEIFPTVGLGIFIRQYTFYGIVLFCISYIAGRGLDFIINDTNGFLHKKKNILICTFLVAVFFILLSAYFSTDETRFQFIKFVTPEFMDKDSHYVTTFYENSEKVSEIRQNGIEGLWILSLLLLISSILIGLLVIKPKSKIIHFAILIFILADLAFFGMDANFYTGDTFGKMDAYGMTLPNYPFEEEFLEFFNEDESFFRVDVNAPNTRWGGKTLFATVHELQIVRGGNPNYLENYIDLLTTMDIFYGFKQHTSDDININSKLFDFFNIKYLISNGYLEDRWSNVDTERWSLVYEFNPKFLIYKNNFVFDRVFFVDKLIIEESREEIRSILVNEKFDPSLIAISTNEFVTPILKNQLIEKNLITDFPMAENYKNYENEVKIIEYNFNSVKIQAKSQVDSFLVLSDIYYPGWKVKVDGQESQILEINLALRGVYLPEGEHDIEFYYDPLSIKIGGVISLATIVTLISLVIIRKRKIQELQSPDF